MKELVQKVQGAHRSQCRHWESSPTLQASEIVKQYEIQHLVLQAEGHELQGPAVSAMPLTAEQHRVLFTNPPALRGGFCCGSTGGIPSQWEVLGAGPGGCNP